MGVLDWVIFKGPFQPNSKEKYLQALKPRVIHGRGTHLQLLGQSQTQPGVR